MANRSPQGEAHDSRVQPPSRVLVEKAFKAPFLHKSLPDLLESDQYLGQTRLHAWHGCRSSVTFARMRELIKLRQGSGRQIVQDVDTAPHYEVPFAFNEAGIDKDTTQFGTAFRERRCLIII